MKYENTVRITGYINIHYYNNKESKATNFIA